MSANNSSETAFPFDELHEQVMAAAEAGQLPLLLAGPASGVEIDALPEDPELGLSAAIRVARVSLPAGTATIAIISPGANGRMIVTEGSHGSVTRQPGDDQELISHLARRTSLQTVDRQLSAILLSEVADDIVHALALPQRSE